VAENRAPRKPARGQSQRSQSGDRPNSKSRAKGHREQRRVNQQGQRTPANRYSKGRPEDSGTSGVENLQRHGPEIPIEITGQELDPRVLAQLNSLPERLGLRVARHLVAAERLLDSQPELAFQHAQAAKSRAARLAVVREAVGEAAYGAGKYAVALSELRAARRMNGAIEYLPIMADCQRALGKPEEALKLAKTSATTKLSAAVKAELTIVEAGARRDLGQTDAALHTLEQAPLLSASRAPWVVRIRYAYADALVEAGRLSEALSWFHRTSAIDSDEITDALERAELLEKELN
jgi:tetratricopeptide (TPR) repeat protein